MATRKLQVNRGSFSNLNASGQLIKMFIGNLKIQTSFLWAPHCRSKVQIIKNIGIYSQQILLLSWTNLQCSLKSEKGSIVIVSRTNKLSAKLYRVKTSTSLHSVDKKINTGTYTYYSYYRHRAIHIKCIFWRSCVTSCNQRALS